MKQVIALIIFILLVSSVSAYNIEFYHSDHLGSPSVITDEAGKVVWSADYDTFGEAINEQGDNDIKYNSKEEDKTGLLYYGARYYNPNTGRFITADTVKGDVLDTQSQNRYVYVKNNPIKYIDPTGEQFDYTSGSSTSVSIPRLSRQRSSAAEAWLARQSPPAKTWFNSENPYLYLDFEGKLGDIMSKTYERMDTQSFLTFGSIKDVAAAVSKVAWNQYDYDYSRRVDGWGKYYGYESFEFYNKVALGEMLDLGRTVCAEKAIFQTEALNNYPGMDFDVELASIRLTKGDSITGHANTLLYSEGDTLVVDWGKTFTMDEYRQRLASIGYNKFVIDNTINPNWQSERVSATSVNSLFDKFSSQ
ncbi:MAG: RHS repeat-associated core domain-containing protein [Nanoarchaeota archaeon]|nr:RHS domain-containing protein [Nanoarchaeota archaeon]MBU1030768.1 RHS domain-containing protein [Nanoarchaeota archaeon]MBU1849913.1 RHS domain-containing protein [Nanoarchaeota archaeon]